MLGILEGAFQILVTSCEFVSLHFCRPMTTGIKSVKGVTSSGPISVSKIETSLGNSMKVIKVFKQYFGLHGNIMDKNNFIVAQASKNKIHVKCSLGL